MAAESTPRLPSSSSVLLEITNVLSQGAFVLINNGTIQRLFHNHVTQQPTGGCSRRTKYDEALLKEASLIYVDLTSAPSLLNLHEWPAKIAQAGYGECKCLLKERVMELTPIGFMTYINGKLYA